MATMAYQLRGHISICYLQRHVLMTLSVAQLVSMGVLWRNYHFPYRTDLKGAISVNGWLNSMASAYIRRRPSKIRRTPFLWCPPQIGQI